MLVKLAGTAEIGQSAEIKRLIPNADKISGTVSWLSWGVIKRVTAILVMPFGNLTAVRLEMQ